MTSRTIRRYSGFFTAVAGIGVVLVSAAVPASAAFFGDDVARKQVAEQGKRVDALSARYEELANRLTSLEDAVKAQAAQSAVQAAQATQPVLDLANQLQLMREELKSLRGQIEVMSHTLEGNAKRQRDMYVDLDTRLRRFEQAPPAPAEPPAATLSTAPPVSPSFTGSGAASAGLSTAPPSGAAPDEARAYEAAQNQRRIGNYQAAIVAFQNFVLQYPRSPLAHRAQYWIGDSYFNLRDFRNAILNQQKLIATYPDTASVPDALLNIASSQLELGETATARKTMDSLIARYPGSEAAEKAKRRLANLR